MEHLFRLLLLLTITCSSIIQYYLSCGYGVALGTYRTPLFLVAILFINVNIYRYGSTYMVGTFFFYWYIYLIVFTVIYYGALHLYFIQYLYIYFSRMGYCNVTFVCNNLS